MPLAVSYLNQNVVEECSASRENEDNLVAVFGLTPWTVVNILEISSNFQSLELVYIHRLHLSTYPLQSNYSF